MTGMKSLAEFASADAKNSNYFSGGVYVGKYFSAASVSEGRAQSAAIPIGGKIARFCASFFIVAVPSDTRPPAANRGTGCSG